MKRTLLLAVVVGLLFDLAAYAAPMGGWTPVQPVPVPQKISYGKTIVTLPDKPVIYIRQGASPVEQYAAETLQKDLKTWFNADVSITKELKADEQPTFVIGQIDTNDYLRKQAGDRISQAIGSLPKKEAYVVSSTGKTIFIAGTDDVGALYGMFTLEQLIERVDGKLVLPSEIWIEDYPVFLGRGQTGAVRDMSAESMRTLDWYARCRINSLYYEINGDEGQDSVPEHMRQVIDECHKRGITIYGQLSNWRTERYLKRELCASNESDVALIRRLFEDLANTGFDGLIFLFDDISGAAFSHTKTCPLCAKNFGNLADSQVFWLRMMKDVAQKHGLDKLMMCPTPYGRHWQVLKEDREYYPQMNKAKDIADIQMFFCPFYSDDIKAIKAAGLRNYVWWQNGVAMFDNRYGLWGGINRVEWGWYGGDSPKIVNEIRTMADRTLYAWVCNGGEVVMTSWGNYCWNPSRYQSKPTELMVANNLFGAGAEGPYWTAVDHIRTWAVKLGTTDGTSKEFESSTAKAEAALGKLKLIIDQTQRPGTLPVKEARNCWWMLDKDLRTLSKAAYAPVFSVQRTPSDKQAKIVVRCRRSDAELRYSVDGSEPSKIYTTPVAINGTVNIKARAYKDGKPCSEVTSATIHGNTATGCKVKLAEAFGNTYAASGSQALTDGIKGAIENGQTGWQGYEGKDMDATVDLGRLVKVRSISANFLQNIGSWIFPPKQVEYAVSKDGTNFKVVATMNCEVTAADKTDAVIKPFNANIKETDARYIRVRAKNIGACPTWHPGADGLAWLFVDELTVN